METTYIIAVIAACASVLFVGYGLRSLASETSGRISSRLQRSGRESNRPARTADITYSDSRRTRFISLEDGASRSWLDRQRSNLYKARIDLHVWEFMAIRAGLAVIAFAVPVIIWGTLLAWLGAALLAVIAWAIPGVMVARRIARRHFLLSEQLDGALTSLASSVRAGFSFQQALKLTLNELEEPLKGELTDALEETTVGGSIEDALANAARRIESYEFNLVVNAVMVHNAVGGNLGDILDAVASTLRSRRELKGHIMSLTAQARLSAIFVAAVPAFMAGFLSITSWDFMHPLWTTQTGNILIFVGLVFNLLGFLLMRRLTRIDF